MIERVPVVNTLDNTKDTVMREYLSSISWITPKILI